MGKTCLVLLLSSLGCGGQMVAGDDQPDDTATVIGSGGATMVTTKPSPAGGYVTTTTSAAGGYVTTTAYARGGATMVTTTPSAAGGYVTTTSTGFCTPSVNLIDAATWTNFGSGDWIGGEPASTLDNPCGVQGAIYAYSDDGLDNTAGTGDDTVQVPAVDPEDHTKRLNPCSNGQCCIMGVTSRWPLVGLAADYTASVWGGGIGVELNSPGNGGAMLGYAGPAKGFNITAVGTLNGQALRVAYPRWPYDSEAPFVLLTGIGSYSVPFASVTCPIWSSSCTPPTLYPSGLQLQVVGGEVVGAYHVCVTSITPIL